MKSRIIAFVLLVSFTSMACFGQETDIPAPYRPDEFPQWTLDLRRAEIVTFGSFPLSFMVTALVYDLTYLAIDSYNYNNDSNLYDRASFASHRTQDDITRLLLISGGVSLTIGLADFIINKVKQKKAEREKQELNEQRNNNRNSTGDSETEN
ncbi:hypothetical protein [Spirochaeta isovalerica]|uniref:Lipoprotein n=1 Tax=Spirochaeta isovalerica TaxID=150 RepID=A0A841R586_9SPIO|nr:hypothetical protein [Spirochaeta isovalerica]MBB6478986.1 hypothetical protein [Spirochaeta isovalerica]